MPRYDVHQHLWPESLVAALTRRREPPCLEAAVCDLGPEGRFAFDPSAHDLDARIAELDRDETDVAVVSLQPTLAFDGLAEDERAELVAAYHEGIAEVVGAAGGRVRAFAAGAALDGFAGATVAAPAVVAGGPELDDLAGALERRGQVLFVHPGPCHVPAGAPGWWAAVVDYTAQMQAAYLAWLSRRAEGGPRPAAIFAVLAGGGPIQAERLTTRGVSDRFPVDAHVYFDVAGYGPRALELCLATFGTRQFVFGSDAPVLDPRSALRTVGSFGEAVAEVIRAENPMLLFG